MSRASGAPDVRLQFGEEQPHEFYLHSNKNTSSTSHFPSRESMARIMDVGIFRDTLAPSLALHTSLSVIAWGAGRYTNRVEAKDWLWPASQVINVWWSAVGRRVFEDGVPLLQTLGTLSWPERLILTGISAWGLRLFYRIATRSLKRKTDDPRYKFSKTEQGFWNKALFTIFLPEALFQSIVSLPFTAPFRHQGQVLTGYSPALQMLAVGIFSSGFALECLADYQLDAHQQAASVGGLQKGGVWSIVRHPNYLGDTLVHASIPLLLYASDMLAPIELLGPIANYIFIRYFGGDKENEASQEARYAVEDPVKKAQLEQWKDTKNSFWPRVEEISNNWTLIVLGCGAAGVAVEQALKTMH